MRNNEPKSDLMQTRGVWVAIQAEQLSDETKMTHQLIRAVQNSDLYTGVLMLLLTLQIFAAGININRCKHIV